MLYFQAILIFGMVKLKKATMYSTGAAAAVVAATRLSFQTNIIKRGLYHNIVRVV